MKQPSPTTFWRFIFTAISFFALFAYWSLVGVTQRLGIIISTSKPWIALFVLLGLFTIAMVSLLIASYTQAGKRLIEFLEFSAAGEQKFLGILLTLIGLTGFAVVTSNAYYIRVMGNASVRYLILILFSLAGMWGIKLIRYETPWMTSLIATLLCQSVIQLVLSFVPQVTTYPFAMGWSETSRFYFPSLYLSEKIHGQGFNWPILHPTLHLLLVPPYIFDAPLWFHRLWQVVIRFVLIGLIIPPLLKRLAIEERPLRWLVALWMFLYLFTGPIYFHLAVPVIIILWGFSLQDTRWIWVAILLASIWAGWSRVNWYPVPAMIAAVLYLMEEPVGSKRIWNYLLKPFLWFVAGTLTAFLSQRIYIALSGIEESGSFYTSLSSDLLWYRLLPNASYFLGLIPAALLLSLPMWLVIYHFIRAEKRDAWHPIRLFLTFGALFVLFIGGLLVSLKIGGGVDLHNLDAYLVLLLIVSSYFGFGRYHLEHGGFPRPVRVPWFLVLAMLLMPAWSYLRLNLHIPAYDETRTQTVLNDLQVYVDDVNAKGGKILFITQRHLISMHMLNDVTLVPEYEREDLMEMAMANNEEYLGEFRTDMENQRFDLIVVDPLTFKILSRNRSFSEENNVWVRRVMKQILCNYRQEAVFAEDDIALYVPQEGTRQCPEK